MSAVIETNELTKVYKGISKTQDVQALKKLSITVNKGEIFGFLGPNGSGKTTTIKMLLGLIFPTSGSIKIMGKQKIDSPEIRRAIGYLPEGAYYPDFLKGEEVLKYYGGLYGLSGKDLARRVDETLDIVGMTRARKRMIRGYSKGMRQRIGLAQALLCDPKLLILDEPTTGLDPVARKEIRDLLVLLRSQGKTLFISSHELLEVELISNRVGILFEGDLQTIGTMDELLLGRDLTMEIRGATQENRARLAENRITIEDIVGDKSKLRVPEETTIFEAMELCKAQKIEIVSVSPRRETLEEVFVRIVGSAVKSKEGSK